MKLKLTPELSRIPELPFDPESTSKATLKETRTPVLKRFDPRSDKRLDKIFDSNFEKLTLAPEF